MLTTVQNISWIWNGAVQLLKKWLCWYGLTHPVLYFGMFSRDVDDKIIYALNLSTPTASIQARGANSTGNQNNVFRTFPSLLGRVLNVAGPFSVYMDQDPGSWSEARIAQFTPVFGPSNSNEYLRLRLRDPTRSDFLFQCCGLGSARIRNL